jgi:hypothetical protein
MFPLCNIHKFSWKSPEGKYHNQIDHTLKLRRQHSSLLDVHLFRAADCGTDNYLMVTEVRKGLAVNKQTSHGFHMEGFDRKKLNEVEGKNHYHIEVSNWIAALEDWTLRWLLIVLRKISERITKFQPKRIRYVIMNWFGEGCSELLDQRKQAIL